MHVRRSFATTAATALITLPLLTSCGFGSNTDKVNTNTAGTINQDGSVDIVAATVVASGPDSGTFIANLSNNDQAEDAVFAELAGGEGEDPVTTSEFSSITIPPGGYVNLAAGSGVKISGTFGAGDVISLALGFEGGETITLDVPVVRACDEYTGLDGEDEAATSAASGSAEDPEVSSDPEPTDAPTVEASPAESTEPLAGATEAPSDDLYSCDLTEQDPEE
ncbi:MAG: hypothetical protein LH468_06450 [Nocardioides sp.]|nr:hypothetical protein [Nocardioides sp.]